MTRRLQRALALVFLFAASGFFVYLGYRGWAVNFVPAQYLGYFLATCGVLGLCGVNIWHGGPLDPRHDPQPHAEAEWDDRGPTG
jgi:hypothetical protein